MNSYLNLAQRYLFAHKKKTRLTLFGIIMAVTLVVGIFSMLDALVKFERTQVLESEGNYHILIRNPSLKETDSVRSRIDVESVGMLYDLGEGKINSQTCAMVSIEADFAANMNVELAEGRAPAGMNEIMLEEWYADEYSLKIGDTIAVKLPGESSGEYVITGIVYDWGVTKAAAIPFVFLSQQAAAGLTPVSSQLFILFEDGVDIQGARDEIAEVLNIPGDRFGYNEGLLALMLQTENNRVLKFYAIGAALFVLVLMTAVMMIYNTFNISVMERVCQFGLLRCIGASKAQIKRLVRRESLILSLKAIPLGVIAGMLMTFACSAFLKFYNGVLFGGLTVFNVSVIGIGVGVLIGFLSVFVASLIPAKKAARVSPVNAVSGNYDLTSSRRKKKGFLLKLFSIETAIGVDNAFGKIHTLVFVSGSIAASVILFLAFSVLVHPAFIGTNVTKSYTADITLSSDTGISGDQFERISKLDGTKNVYGRMSAMVTATFDASRLTDEYEESAGSVEAGDNNLIENPEHSRLLSYDATQLNWAKEYLAKGTCDEDELNAHNGIISVRNENRNGITMQTTNLQLGNKVYIQTGSGLMEFTVMGIVDSVPYSTEQLTLTTFITTENLFGKVSSDTLYKDVDIQLDSKNQEQTVDSIRALISKAVTLHDKRQLNSEADNAYMTIAVFVYGFIGVIALISLLNIFNIMNTSVVSRAKYLGTMRAIGMTGKQLDKMVIAQSVTYSLTGCAAGAALGIPVQKMILDFLAAKWTFPSWQIMSVLVFGIATSLLSVISPLSKLKARAITETIGSL